MLLQFVGCADAVDHMPDIFPHLDYEPELPRRMDRGIGIVGAGGIVDPTHALGLREFVPQMCLAAVAAGADALMIEVHDSPEMAKSDGNQALTPEIFAELVPRLRAVATAIGRAL